MSRVINAPTNGPACSVEDLVAQYIDWSPTIYNEYENGFYMLPEQMQLCPTKSQIKNSDKMTVTLYKDAVYDSERNSSIIRFKFGTTYKFNGEIGQFPKLFVTDMFPEFPSTKQYSSNELVKMCDVSAYYNHHNVKIRLNNFTLKNGVFPFVSDNLVLDETNIIKSIDSEIYPYDMIMDTSCGFGLKSLTEINNNEQYTSTSFDYSVEGYDSLNGKLTFSSTKKIVIPDIEHDVIVDITATKKKLCNVFISTDGTISIVDVINIHTSGEENVILTAPGTYATFTTDYPDSTNKIFSFQIVADKPELVESYNYNFTEYKLDGSKFEKSGEDISMSTLLESKKFSGSNYLMNPDNTYELFISTNEAYQGKSVRVIINKESATDIKLEIKRYGSSIWEVLEGMEKSSKIEYSFVTTKTDEDGNMTFRLTCENSIRDYDLIDNFTLTNNKTQKSVTEDFTESGTKKTATIVWDKKLSNGTILTGTIKRIQLNDIVVKRSSTDIVVYDINDTNVVFTSNVATVPTQKSTPDEIVLKIKNTSSTESQLEYTWFARGQKQYSAVKEVKKNNTMTFKQDGLISTWNYRLELKLGIKYNPKTISVIIVNSVGSISVDSASTSEDGINFNNYYSTFGQDGNTYMFDMNKGFYLKVRLKYTQYYYSSCSTDCASRDTADGAWLTDSVAGKNYNINNETEYIEIVTGSIPAECVEYKMTITFDTIRTYLYSVFTDIDNVSVEVFDPNTSNWNGVPFALLSSTNSVIGLLTSSKTPKELKLRMKAKDGSAVYSGFNYIVYNATTENEYERGTLPIAASGWAVFDCDSSYFSDSAVNFKILSFTMNNKNISIDSTFDYPIIITDNYNEDNIVVSPALQANNPFSYLTVAGHVDEVSWKLEQTEEHPRTFSIDLYGSEETTFTAPGTKVGNTLKHVDGGNLTFSSTQDLNGNAITHDYPSFLVKFKEFEQLYIKSLVIDKTNRKINVELMYWEDDISLKANLTTVEINPNAQSETRTDGVVHPGDNVVISYPNLSSYMSVGTISQNNALTAAGKYEPAPGVPLLLLYTQKITINYTEDASFSIVETYSGGNTSGISLWTTTHMTIFNALKITTRTGLTKMLDLNLSKWVDDNVIWTLTKVPGGSGVNNIEIVINEDKCTNTHADFTLIVDYTDDRTSDQYILKMNGSELPMAYAYKPTIVEIEDGNTISRWLCGELVFENGYLTWTGNNPDGAVDSFIDGPGIIGMSDGMGEDYFDDYVDYTTRGRFSVPMVFPPYTVSFNVIKKFNTILGSGNCTVYVYVPSTYATGTSVDLHIMHTALNSNVTEVFRKSFNTDSSFSKNTSGKAIGRFNITDGSISINVDGSIVGNGIYHIDKTFSNIHNQATYNVYITIKPSANNVKLEGYATRYLNITFSNPSYAMQGVFLANSNSIEITVNGNGSGGTSVLAQHITSANGFSVSVKYALSTSGTELYSMTGWLKDGEYYGNGGFDSESDVPWGDNIHMLKNAVFKSTNGTTSIYALSNSIGSAKLPAKTGYWGSMLSDTTI